MSRPLSYSSTIIFEPTRKQLNFRLIVLKVIEFTKPGNIIPAALLTLRTPHCPLALQTYMSS